MRFFQGCTALITGASSGLGWEFAHQLAPHANTLILAARRLDRLGMLKTELARAHPHLNLYCFEIDLSEVAAIDKLEQWLRGENLRVNFLINNAGLGDHGAFESADWSKTKMMLDVNIAALTKLTHALLPTLCSFENAAILNVSSSASFLPVPHMAVYAATKAYVTSFSEALRAEMHGTGVSVTALCPGPVDTEFGEIAKRAGETDKMHAPNFLKVSPEHTVHSALRAVARDRARVVPGFAMSLAMIVVCAMPMFLLRWLLGFSVKRADAEIHAAMRRGVVNAGTFR
jgi:short-subunit dehydrogenase